ncbi:MAG: signal peptidase I [Bacilli bacterium]|nr:signal peptidase I [Bacilli bacterium]
MKKTVNAKKIIRKVLALMVTAVFLAILMIVGFLKFEIINHVYIIIAIILSFLVAGYSLIFKYKFKTKIQKYNYYQIADFFFVLNSALIFIQLFFLLVFFPATVYKTSMNPNLLEGDNLIVFSLGKVKRGEIIIVKIDEEINTINNGVEDDELIVKRVIAGPGDSFYFDQNGILYLNGKMVNEQYLKDEFGEFLKGYSYNTHTTAFELGDSAIVSGENVCPASGVCRIPENYYFVMGDNRRYSIDSRDLGLIHKSQIMGVAKYKKQGLFDWVKLK